MQLRGPEIDVITYPGTVYFRFGGATITAGTTYHVVYSLADSYAFGAINGATYQYAVAPVGYSPTAPGSSGFTIGAGTGFFQGTIDEVAVYNYGLSEQQAFAHYIAGNDSTPSASTAVVEVAFYGNATEDYYQQVADDLAYLYFRLNEASGASFANYTDVILNGYTLPPATSNNGTITHSVAGVLTNDSADAAITLGTATYLIETDIFAQLGGSSGGTTGFLNNFTLEAWVNLNSAATTERYIISKSGSYGFSVGAVSGKLRGFVSGGVSVDSSATVSAGEWHHLAATYDGTVLQLYIDGVPDNSGGTSAIGVGANTNNVDIGRDHTQAGTYLDGSIDEVAIYGSALSAERIGMHYGTRLNQRPLVYTDISSYVRGYTVSQGRQHELDRYEAATLSVRVNNDDRRFEPDYTGSPYYPNVLPYRRIRVWESKDGVRFPIFNGWVERWPEQWIDQSYHAEVEIQAVDGFDILSSALVDATSVTTGQTTDIEVQAALTDGANWDEQAFPIVRAYQSGVDTQASTSTSTSVLSLIQTLEATENGEFYIDRFGRPTFVARDGRDGAPVLATFGDWLISAGYGAGGFGVGPYGGAAQLPYRDIVPSLDRDRVLNDITVTRDGGTAQVARNYDSIAAYGPKSLQVSTLNSSDADALTTAQSILDSHATPSRRVESISLLYGDGGSNPLLVQLLTRQIGDKITVVRQPDQTGVTAALSEDCLISHVAMTRSPKLLEVTWQLIPA